MSSTADVVIVGGGVAGCSIAYYLACEGMKALVIERDGIGSQASGVAAGMLTPLAEASVPGPAFDLALRSLHLHGEQARQLRDETSIDVHYGELPVLRLAFTEEEERRLRQQMMWQQKSNLSTGLEPTPGSPKGQPPAGEGQARLDVSWVDGADLPRLEPCATAVARGAVRSACEAQVDGYRLTVALAQAATRRGAAIRNGSVVGVRRDGGRLAGLVLASGEVLSGGVYIFAMGPWTSQAGEWLGFPVPVEPLRGQLIKLKAAAARPRHVLFHGGNYVLPKVDSSVLAGTTEEWAGFESRVTEEGNASIMETVRVLAPALESAQVTERRAGLRPVSRDGLPILGAAPGWRNVFLATGYGRKGILLSAVTGRLMAGLVAHGRTPISLAPFAPDRFLTASAAR